MTDMEKMSVQMENEWKQDHFLRWKHYSSEINENNHKQTINK